VSTYVYGIARADDVRLPEGARGIGEPACEVRTVVHEDLAAVVSDAPAGPVRPKRRDLLAHQKVLAETNGSGAVLPMRFGMVSPDDEAVRTVLAERAGHWHERLSSLDGRAEYNVKAAHNNDAILHQVLAEEPDIRALSAANRAADGGSHEDRLRLGEMVANAVRAREERDASVVRQALEPLAEAAEPGPESSGWLLNLSFLVRRDAAERFVAAAEELLRDHPHLELRVNGPLPPYSFVEGASSAGAESAAMADRA
jgi:gas vesicle protein GvpL/GvpF